MQIIALTCILTLLLSLFYLLKIWKNKYNNIYKARGNPPPQPVGSWPLLGHLHLLVGDNIKHVVLGKLADKYGSIFMIRLGSYRALVISSPQVAKECLGGDNDRVFANRPRTALVNHMTYNSAMFAFSPYGPYWREIRKIATLELLSNRKIEMMKELRKSELRLSLKSIHEEFIAVKRNSRDGELVLDMKEWIQDLTLNTAMKLVVGKPLRELLQGEEYEGYKKDLREFNKNLEIFVIGDGFPLLRWLDIGGHEKAMKMAWKNIDFYIRGWLEEHRRRRGGRGEVRENQDFMDVMLDLFEKGHVKSSNFDEDTIIKATCMNLMIGGVETITVTLTWALSLLLNNKEVLEKAWSELDTEVGKGAREVTESDLKNLTYLQAIIKETMRLYPAAPLALPHEASSDCRINDYHISKGTKLIMNLYKIHRDPHVWAPDPLEFRPERFLERDYDVRVGENNDFELIPFGCGRRICPGVSLALQIVPFTLANVLNEFEISTPMGKQVDMTEGLGLSIQKASPLEVILTPRRLLDDLRVQQ